MAQGYASRIAVAIPLVAFAGCAINGPRPSPVPAPMPPLTDVSTISVPIQISSGAVSKLIDNEVSDQGGGNAAYHTTGDKSLGHGLTFQLFVRRAAPTTASSSNGGLHVEVPMTGNGRVDGEALVPFVGNHHVDTNEFGANVEGDLKVLVDQNWQLQGSTGLNVVWTKDPKITLLGVVPFDIAGFVNNGLRPILNKAQDTVDKALANVDTQNLLEDVWQQLQAPIPIPSAANAQAWLSIKPIRAGLGAPTTNGNDLVVHPTIAAELTISLKKPTAAPVLALPKNTNAPADSVVKVALHADAPYDDLTRIAKSILIGHPLDAGKGISVDVQAVKVYGNGENVVVDLNFLAKNAPVFLGHKRVHIYLTGKPAYDDDTRRITVNHFGYVLQAGSITLRTVDWLAHSLLTEKISQILVFDVSKYVDPIREAARVGVAGQPIDKYASITASFPTANIATPWVGPTGLSVFLNVSGRACVNVNAFPGVGPVVPLPC